MTLKGGSTTTIPGEDVRYLLRDGRSTNLMPEYKVNEGYIESGGTQGGIGRGGGGGGGGSWNGGGGSGGGGGEGTFRTQGGVLLDSRGNIVSEPPHPTSVAAVQQRLANERMANRQPAKSVDEVSAEFQSRLGYSRDEADDLAQYLTSRSGAWSDLVDDFHPTGPETSILRLPPATIQRAGTRPLILPFHPTDRFALSESIPEYDPPRIQSVLAAPPSVEPTIAPYRVATPDIDSRPEPEHQTGTIWVPGQAWGTSPVPSSQVRTLSEPVRIPEIPQRLIPIPAQAASAAPQQMTVSVPEQVTVPVTVPQARLGMGTADLPQLGPGTTTALDTNLAPASYPDLSLTIPQATPYGPYLNPTAPAGPDPLRPRPPRPNLPDPSQDEGHDRVIQLPTRPGLYPDGVTWISHSLNRYDPQTDEHTAAPLSDTNVRTLNIDGLTREAPQDKEVLAGNLAVRASGGKLSAGSVPYRSVRVDTGTPPKAPKVTRRARRTKKGPTRPDAEGFVVPEPILYIGRGK